MFLETAAASVLSRLPDSILELGLNAAHQTVVGYRFVCVGYSGGWGTITPYSVIGPYPCH